MTSNTLIAHNPIMIRTPVLTINNLFSLYTQSFSSFDLYSHDNFKFGPDTTVLEEDRQKTHHWILQMLEDPVIIEAILVASPSLYQSIQSIKHDASKSNKIYNKLLMYLCRMSVRPTPYGIFSGVDLGTWGDKTKLRLNGIKHYTTRTRPDMDWLLRFVEDIETQTEIKPYLTHIPNPIITVRNDRISIPYLTTISKGSDKQGASLRATNVVLQVLELAKNGMTLIELQRQMTLLWPSVPIAKFEALIATLCDLRVIVSNLAPPLVGTDPATYVLKKLQQIPLVERDFRVLEELLALCALYDEKPLGAGLEVLHQIAVHTNNGSYNNAFPVQVDLKINYAEPTISHAISDEIGSSLRVMCLLSTALESHPHLIAYKTRFTERYGVGKEVPLLEVLDENKGIGPPNTYLNPLPSRGILSETSMKQSKRDIFLLDLVTTALQKGQKEIFLTEEILSELTTVQEWQKLIPNTLEGYISILAPSIEAIEAGQYRLLIGPRIGTSPAGRSFGRFYDLFSDSDDLDALFALHTADDESRVVAELVTLSSSKRTANVTIRPKTASYEIPAYVTPSVDSDHVISIDDLVLGLQGNRFYVRSLSLNKEVVVTSCHLLNMFSAPNICRFLYEIGEDVHIHLTGFYWGSAGQLPFLPRISFGKAILSPAKWIVPIADLLAEGESLPDVYKSVQQWRKLWDVPRHVYFTQADHRLLLDLLNPCCVEILINEGQKSKSYRQKIEVQEPIPGLTDVWQQAEDKLYISEFVVPFSLEPKNLLRFPITFSPNKTSNEVAQKYYDSDWLFIKIYVGFSNQIEFIANNLDSLLLKLKTEGDVLCWFFIRYNDPEPHLRLRFQGMAKGAFKSILPMFTEWKEQWIDESIVNRIVIDTYDREIDRYGGSKGLEISEQMFMIDSEINVKIIGWQIQEKRDLPSSVVAAITINYILRHLGLNIEIRHQILATMRQNREQELALNSTILPAKYRIQRKLLEKVISGREGIEAQIPNDLATILSSYSTRLNEIGQSLQNLQEAKVLTKTKYSIISDYIHMHCNRRFGTTVMEELEVIYYLERTLNSLIRRHK